MAVICYCLISNHMFVMVLLRELKGLVVTLSSEGHLQCSYMGTDPSFFNAPKVDSREVNYDEVDAEMKVLQKVIREATRNQGRIIICLSQENKPLLFG